MTMRRIVRDRRLTPEEAAKYRQVREQVEAELPELVARHQERTQAFEMLEALLLQLKSAREASGLSLADMTERTGMDRSALSKLETGQRRIRPSRRSFVTPKRWASDSLSVWKIIEVAQAP